MRYRRFGDTGLVVSEICYGPMRSSAKQPGNDAVSLASQHAGPDLATIKDDSVGILLDEGHVSLDYYGLDGLQHSIYAAEPVDVFATFEFYDLCGVGG